MSSSKLMFESNRNLYLQILQKAQQESDYELVNIIAKKIAASVGATRRTADGCQIFSLPNVPGSALIAGADVIDWKDRRVWWNLFWIWTSFGFLTSWFLFFCERFLPL